MSGRLVITNITGVAPYNVYVADQYGNNNTLIATIGGAVPPQQYMFLPPMFNGIDKIMVTITDSSGCDYCSTFKILDCRFGCAFDIVIEEINCRFSINVSETTCEVNQIRIY
jgi:hypothetical protein